MQINDKNDIINSAIVLRLWQKTNNPYIIAKAMGINIKFCDVGLNVLIGDSYYSQTIQEIKINIKLKEEKKIAVCAHELGHIVFKHTGKSYYKDNDLENEYCANLFAVALLYLDNRFESRNEIFNLTNYSLQIILDKGYIKYNP